MGYENELCVCKESNKLVKSMKRNRVCVGDRNRGNSECIMGKVDGIEKEGVLDKIDSLGEKKCSLICELSKEDERGGVGCMINEGSGGIVSRVNDLE